MATRRRGLWAALCITGVLASCSEPFGFKTPPTTRTVAKRYDPRLELLDPGAAGLIVVCSSGGPASFTVTATPNVGTLAGGGSFSLTDGQCVTAWQAVAGDLQTVGVAVTQTAGDFDHIEGTAVPIIGLPRMVIDNTKQGIRWDTNADHGGSATFFQTPVTPPTSKKLVVCKVGPAGTYSFSVSSSSADGNVFPNGTEFTVDAGQCKDAWMADKPPVFPVDPKVTVTELGDAPLDSIVKEPQDSAATTLLGTREVTTSVGFYHGGVVTYYNSVCLDENATNFGGTPPCHFPPPSVSCVAITAVQGVAITPVTLTASGGAGAPYTFSATGLPAGLSMSSSGTISGTPTVSGTFSYTVTVTDKDGNSSSATCEVNVDVAGKTFTIGPSSMEGDLKIPINSWVNGGYSFKFVSGNHLATTFTVTAKVELPVTCKYGGAPGGTIVVSLGTKSYSVPAGNTSWLPTGDANSILSWMGAVRAPDLCGGFTMNDAKGAVFTATVSQNPPSGSLVDFRFKYRDPAGKGKVDTNCTDANEPKRNDAATCGASWSQTVRDP